MPTVVNKDKTGGLLCSEHPKASVGIKPLDLNLKANRVRMNTRKLIYIEVLKRGDRQTVQKNTRVMFECPATASSFLLTSFCHLMQSDHGVRRFLVTVKKKKKETQSIDKNDFFICICMRPCIRGQSIYFDMFVIMNWDSTRIDKAHLSQRI